MNDFVPKCVFQYSTEHLQKKDKVRFYYALKGRDGHSGIVKNLSIEHLGKTVLLVPENKASDVDSFLNLWKCKFNKRDFWVKK